MKFLFELPKTQLLFIFLGLNSGLNVTLGAQMFGDRCDPSAGAFWGGQCDTQALLTCRAGVCHCVHSWMVFNRRKGICESPMFKPCGKDINTWIIGCMDYLTCSPNRVSEDGTYNNNNGDNEDDGQQLNNQVTALQQQLQSKEYQDFPEKLTCLCPAGYEIVEAASCEGERPGETDSDSSGIAEIGRCCPMRRSRDTGDVKDQQQDYYY